LPWIFAIIALDIRLALLSLDAGLRRADSSVREPSDRFASD
jgi:hypothetical protein